MGGSTRQLGGVLGGKARSWCEAEMVQLKAHMGGFEPSLVQLAAQMVLIEAQTVQLEAQMSKLAAQMR